MKFYSFVLRRPWHVIWAVAVVTLFFAWHARRVELNNSIEALLPEGHPAMLQDREIKEVFGSREMILIGILHEGGIFHRGTLLKVAAITDAVREVTVAGRSEERALARWAVRLGEGYAAELNGLLTGGLTTADRGAVRDLRRRLREDPAVDGDFLTFVEELHLRLNPISDVISLSTADNVTSNEWGLNVDPPMREVPQSADELADLTRTVFENEMFAGGLVARDGTGTLILAELSFHYDDYLDVAHEVFRAIEEVVSRYRGPEDIRQAGVPMVNVYTSNYMNGDLTRLTPLVILIVLLMLFATLRSWQGVLLPLAVVVGALIWTLGLMGLTGRPITLVVTAMPVMLIAIGIADGIHLVSEYQFLMSRSGDHHGAILETMRRLTRPVGFTSLTTMAGFGALATSNLRSIQDFGLFTAFGVLTAMIFSLTFIPAALKLTRPSARTEFSSPRLERFLGGIGRFAVSRRRLVFAAAVFLAAASTLALTRLEVGSRMVGSFHQDSAIYQASEMINAKFGGTEVLNVLIDTGRPDGLKNPEILASIAALQDTLEALPIVGYSTSLADYVRRIHGVMQDSRSGESGIPGLTEEVVETVWVEENGVEKEITRTVEVSGQEMIAQYLLLYESAGGESLTKLVDNDYRKANVVVQIRTDYTPALRTVRQVAQDFGRRHFGTAATVTFAGCSNLCIVGDDLIIPSQMKSLGVALLVVFVLLILIFRSVRYAALGLLPLVLTVLLVFGLMSSFGVNLDAATALVASIVLGIGIDYSIHFLVRYRAIRPTTSNVSEAVQHTMMTSGRAIFFNSVAVALGFLVLMLSSFWPVMHIGWLVAANMLFGSLLVLVLVPALLAVGSPKAEAVTA